MQRPVRSNDHCCETGVQRKMKTNVKTNAQVPTMAYPAKIQLRSCNENTRMYRHSWLIFRAASVKM